MITESRQVLVDGVIQHLKDEVVQTAFIGVSNVHPRPLSDRIQSLQFIDLGSVVCLLFGDRDSRLFGLRFSVRHRCPKGDPEPGFKQGSFALEWPFWSNFF